MRAKAREIGSKARAKVIGPKEKARAKAKETKAKAKDSKEHATIAVIMGTRPESAVRQIHSKERAPSAVSGDTWRKTVESEAGYKKSGKTQKTTKKDKKTNTGISAS